MLSKTVARLGIIAGLTATTLGNYWYTFGLWPKSWVAFFGFFFIAILLAAVNTAMGADDK